MFLLITRLVVLKEEKQRRESTRLVNFNGEDGDGKPSCVSSITAGHLVEEEAMKDPKL